MEVGSEVSVARVVAKTFPPRFSRTQSCREAAPSAAVGTVDVRLSAKSTGSGVEGVLVGVAEVVAAVGSVGALVNPWISWGEDLSVDGLGAAVEMGAR